MIRKVFITGATGYLGGAIAARLVRAGLDVRGLAQSPERAEAIKAAGVKPTLGRLQEPEGYLSEMKNCDAVVHAGLDDRDPAGGDQAALEAIRAATLDGRVRRLLYTSGVWVHGDTGGAVVDETAPLAAAELVRWRPAHEEAALDIAREDVTTVILRPAMVYGERRGAFGGWFREAAEQHTVTYPGDGRQHWGAVHRDDVAEAYALALEHAAGGERYLLSDDARATVAELAAAVAAATGAVVRPQEPEAVLRTLGAYGAALLLDQQFSAARARRELGWVPRHASFVAEAPGLWREWQETVPDRIG